jgi:hypothetical protein
MKQSQLITVSLILRDKGEVTRNQCLKKHITRLSDIIYRLSAMGWKFKERKAGYETIRGEERNGDYVYKLKSIPRGVRKILDNA